MTLSHLDGQGRPKMVDVGTKPATDRTAVAEGAIRMKPEAFAAVRASGGPKGDILVTAELAGTVGAKKTSDLIPLCHPIGLDHIEVSAKLDPDLPGVRVRARARVLGRTGVEMEALTAVSVALLTVYDMVKATGHALEIGPIHLVEKTGGTRGDWRRNAG
jgi:cyclic pyranopterin monophosphate synthase